MMQKAERRRIAYLPLSVAALLLVSACADLQSIRKFADTAVDVPGYTALVKDYPKSAKRLIRINPEEESDLRQLYAERKAQQPGLLALHEGMTAYMQALGALASDEIVSYDKPARALEKAAQAIRKIEGLDSKKADQATGAVISLTTRIASTATTMFRQRKLRQLIDQSNTDFQIIVETLHVVVGTCFPLSLGIEATMLDDHYGPILQEAEKTPPSKRTASETLSIELLRDTWLERKGDVAAKIETCEHYAKVLNAIGQGHQMLFDKQKELSAKAVRERISALTEDVRMLRNQINDLM